MSATCPLYLHTRQQLLNTQYLIISGMCTSNFSPLLPMPASGSRFVARFISSIGSHAPLSSMRPLLSVEVSVCLFVCRSVRCPRPFTHFQLTDFDETWLKLVAFKFHPPAPLAAELWTKNLIFTNITWNATPPTVLNPVLRYFGITVSYIACI